MIEHGSFDIEVKKNTIVFSAYDAWNYPTTLRLGIEIKALAATLDHSSWSCIADCSKWELATPDVGHYFNEINIWLNNTNLQYLAVVYGLEIHKELFLVMHKVFTDVEVRYFENLKDAEKWLAESN